MTTALLFADPASARTRVAGLSQIARSVLSLRRAGFQSACVKATGDAGPMKDLLAREGQGFPVEWDSNGPAEGPLVVLETSHVVDVPAHPADEDSVVFYEDAALLACPAARAEALRPLLAQATSVADLASRAQAAGLPVERRRPDFFAHPVADPAAAERALIRTLTKPGDGPIATYFDRKLSGLISRGIVRTPLLPNHVTLIASAIGILGGWLISLGTYWGGVAGSALFVLSTILDGCDGEVARLKFRESHFGYLLDLVLDNVVYLCIYAGIAVGLARSWPGIHPYLACALMAGGIAIDASLMYFFVLRPRLSDRIPFLRFLEKIGNGDFSYFVLLIAFAGHLEVFLWGSVVGIYVFIAVLVSYLMSMHSEPEGAKGTAGAVPSLFVDARSPGALLRVGGVPAAGRILRAAHYAGVAHAAVRGEGLPRLDYVPQAATEGSLAAPVLFADGALVVDPRIVKAMVAHGAPCRVATPGEGVRLALLDACAWEEWRGGGGIDAARLPLLDLSAVGTWSREHRAESPVYVEEVASQEDAEAATERLLLATQKHVLDLPAEYLDPPFENAITRALVDTSVTPNQVTLFCALVAAGIAWMFLNGWLLAGALCTYLVEWLDGVDGKLARLRLQYSELGKNESTVDYFCENAWWVCLGVFFAGQHAPLAWWAMGVLVLSDTLDNLWAWLCGAKGLPHPSEYSAFDRAFHRIGGRRNIYCAMLLLGVLSSAAWPAYLCVSAWAFLTQALHVVRIAQRLHRRRAD